MLASRKEIISYILLLTAVSCTWLTFILPSFIAYPSQFICVLNASLFANILPLHSSYEQVAKQVVSVGTAYICVIFAMSTWLYHSNYHRARLEMRLVLVAMIIAMMACNIVTTYFFRQALSFIKLQKCMDLTFMISSFGMASRDVSLALSIISILLLFVALVMIIVKIYTSQRKRRLAQLKDMV